MKDLRWTFRPSKQSADKEIRHKSVGIIKEWVYYVITTCTLVSVIMTSLACFWAGAAWDSRADSGSCTRW